MFFNIENKIYVSYPLTYFEGVQIFKIWEDNLAYEFKLRMWDAYGLENTHYVLDHGKKCFSVPVSSSKFDSFGNEVHLFNILPGSAHECELFISWCLAKYLPFNIELVTVEEYKEQIEKDLFPEEYLDICLQQILKIEKESYHCSVNFCIDGASEYLGLSVKDFGGWLFYRWMRNQEIMGDKDLIKIVESFKKIGTESIKEIGMSLQYIQHGSNAGKLKRFLLEQKSKQQKGEALYGPEKIDDIPMTALELIYFISKRINDFNVYFAERFIYKKFNVRIDKDYSFGSRKFYNHVYRIIDAIDNEDIAHIVYQMQSELSHATRVKDLYIIHCDKLNISLTKSDFYNVYDELNSILIEGVKGMIRFLKDKAERRNIWVDLNPKFNQFGKYISNTIVPFVESKSDNPEIKDFYEKLTQNGFEELPKIKSLTRESRRELVELIKDQGAPYQIAMLDCIGFLDYILSQVHKVGARNQIISVMLNVTLDTVKKNILSLTPGSTIRKDRYTAWLHKESVLNDYNKIKNAN